MDGISFDKQHCTFEGRTVPHGAELCSLGLCKLCDNGELEIPQELLLDGQDLLADPGEAYFVPI